MSGLLFVYNADSGFVDAVMDTVHKFFSPSTYTCNLCSLTHSAFGVRARWQNFVASLDEIPEFLHRDEFRLAYAGAGIETPCLLRAEGDVLQVLIPAEEMAGFIDLESLMARVEAVVGGDAT